MAFYKFVKKNSRQNTVLKKYKPLEKELQKKIFEAIPEYKISKIENKVFSNAFCGNGWRLTDIRYVAPKCRKVRCYNYDINKAYPFALKERVYPLSAKYSIIDKEMTVNEAIKLKGLYLFCIEMKNKMTRKWKFKFYDIYKNYQFKSYAGTGYRTGWLSNIDLKCMNELYKLDNCIIRQAIKFEEVGKLDKRVGETISKFADETKRLKRAKAEDELLDQRKVILNKNVYGIFAKKKGKKTRRSTVLLAIFETAYIKELMIEYVKKIGIDKVISINTDGLICLENSGKIEVSDKMGKLKDVWGGMRYVDLKGDGYYIAYREDGSIEEQITHLHHELTVEQIEEAMKHKVVIENDRFKTVKGKRVGIKSSIYFDFLEHDFISDENVEWK